MAHLISPPVDRLTLQIFLQGTWHDAGYAKRDANTKEVTVGYFQPYVDRWFQRAEAAFSISFLPETFRKRYDNALPGFLADLLPQGAVAERMRAHLGITDYGPAGAFSLLAFCAGNPIGNLRIKEAHERLFEQTASTEIAGLSLEQLTDGQTLIDYLASDVWRAAGSQSLQGEWPKAIVTLADDGLYYLDHELPDDRARKHFILKFPRKDSAGRFAEILASEAALHQQGGQLGFLVYGSISLHNGHLLIERFDRRVTDGGVARIGQESLLSALDLSSVVQLVRHDTVLELLLGLAEHAGASVVEYLARDAWNVLTDNRDNHGRNTALQRSVHGVTELSPLFDVNHSFLHPGSLARAMRWCEHESNGKPHWTEIIAQLPDPAWRLAAHARLDQLFRSLRTT